MGFITHVPIPGFMAGYVVVQSQYDVAEFNRLIIPVSPKVQNVFRSWYGTYDQAAFGICFVMRRYTHPWLILVIGGDEQRVLETLTHEAFHLGDLLPQFMNGRRVTDRNDELRAEASALIVGKVYPRYLQTIAPSVEKKMDVVPQKKRQKTLPTSITQFVPPPQPTPQPVQRPLQPAYRPQPPPERKKKSVWQIYEAAINNFSDEVEGFFERLGIRL